MSKPRKRYIPKPVNYPKIITQIHSFKPFEDALSKLLETGESEIDSYGILIYRSGDGKILSFSDTIKLYLDIIHIYCTRTNNSFKTRHLKILQNRLFEGRGFSESEVKQARECLEVCKKIICNIPGKELKDILNTIRISLSIERVVNPTLKEHELKVAKYKRTVGDLEFEDVMDRDKEYRELHEKYPEDELIKKLHDIYLDFASAYRLYKFSSMSIESKT